MNDHERFFVAKDAGYDGFSTEADYQGYLAELERKRRKCAARTPEAIRQDRCHKRRRTAERYWEVFLKTGSRPESWVADLSEAILDKARAKMVARYPAWAKLRGLS